MIITNDFSYFQTFQVFENLEGSLSNWIIKKFHAF